ncbi:MAG: sigma-E factor negative regulatory protein [Rhizobacter sp.]
MSNPSQTQPSRAELLSALADGELDASGTLAACELWRSDEQAQIQWADYHLIGDVLRSEDLARSGAHESSLFARIQTELAQQAVVLAPRTSRALSPGEPVVAARHLAARHTRRAWWTVSAVAAGFVVVAGAWSVFRVPLPVDSGALIAQSEPAPLSVSASAATAPEIHVGAGMVVRDVELDRYLAAHKQFSSTSVLGAASGSLRQVVLESSGR